MSPIGSGGCRLTFLSPLLPSFQEDDISLHFSVQPKNTVAKAAGGIIAELVSPYPPGIPGLVPGELVTPTMVD